MAIDFRPISKELLVLHFSMFVAVPVLSFATSTLTMKQKSGDQCFHCFLVVHIEATITCASCYPIHFLVVEDYFFCGQNFSNEQ